MVGVLLPSMMFAVGLFVWPLLLPDGWAATRALDPVWHARRERLGRRGRLLLGWAVLIGAFALTTSVSLWLRG